MQEKNTILDLRHGKCRKWIAEDVNDLEIRPGQGAENRVHCLHLLQVRSGRLFLPCTPSARLRGRRPLIGKFRRDGPRMRPPGLLVRL